MSTVVTLQPPTIDAFIYSLNATKNYGSETYLSLGEINTVSGAIYRSLIKFDLSSIPTNAVVSSAVLSLYCTTDRASNARTYRVFRTLRAWTEAGVTWNKYDGTNNWGAVGGFDATDCEQTDIGTRDFTATETVNEYKDFPLTASAVQAMIDGSFTNNGFLLKVDTENNDGYYFSSSEAPSNTPKLVITYDLPTTTATYRTRRGVNLLGRHERRLIF